MRKRNLLSIVCASLVIVSLSGCSWEAIDANGDGTLSLEELDADGDGTLSRSDLMVALINSIASCTTNSPTDNPSGDDSGQDTGGTPDEGSPMRP